MSAPNLSPYPDLEAVRSRIVRAFRAVNRADGDGYETSYQAAGTDFTTDFRATGVKAPEQLEDDFLNLFVWTWSLKDYIKAGFRQRGLSEQEVEEIANKSRALACVADIANRAKHGILRTSRSGGFAELVDVGFEAPQASIARITVSGPAVAVELRNPELIRIHATVRTSSGEEHDALAILSEAMDVWERQALIRVPPE